MQQQEEEMEEAGGDHFQTIDRLEGPGLGAPDIKKLKEAGYHTIQAVAFATRKELGGIKGISDNKVEKILESSMKMIGSMGFTTATEVCAQRRIAQSERELSPDGPNSQHAVLRLLLSRADRASPRLVRARRFIRPGRISRC